MSSVVIAGNTSGTITLSAPAIAGSNTLTLPASTGTLLTSTMNLLGTITPTAVNSISISGLTLTSYKSLFIVINNIAGNVTTSQFYISSTNIQTGGGVAYSGTTGNSGTGLLDLSTGAIGGGACPNSVSATSSLIGGLTNVSTSTTTIYFRMTGTSIFTAQGSIIIYGVY